MLRLHLCGMETPLFAYIAFAFATSITPGPNNALMLANGARFGLRASLPALAGLFVGFFLMTFAAAQGLGRALENWPHAQLALRIAGAGYMAFLAASILRANTASTPAKSSARPVSLFEMAALQWLNPKAWLMATSAAGAFSAHWPALIFSLIFGAINTPCVGFWALVGATLQRAQTSQKIIHGINLFCAALLALSALSLLYFS